jgi:glycerol-3-phosphate acyltransferase PlsY
MTAISITRDLGIIISSFLVGAIPFCFILGKIVGKKRLTDIGDRNPGGWNLVFNVSKIWGFIGILLDMAKGYFAYFIAYRFASSGFIPLLDITNSQLIAILAGCAAVLGHNYTPYLKFKGGKGLATWGGFMIAIHPLNLILGGAGLLLGLLVARNMIWAVSLGIIFCGIFSWIIRGHYIFGIMIVILLLIMLPKQINRTVSLGQNFKFRKEASLGDLFKPKIR